MTKKTNIIGLMSGSSLDGIDLVDVDFWNDGKWHFEIVAKDNYDYDDEWRNALSDAFLVGAQHATALQSLDIRYGTLLGQVTKQFIDKYNLHPEIVASHGHTIFHRPQEHYTLQIGDGQALADACGVMVINDFRTEDVLKGGQGAPLVPIGDKLLFADYPLCLNIGGIANVSYDVDGQRIAYDICIANQALNYLANRISLPYDKDGMSARSGHIDNQLLTTLNSHPFYTQKHPKSLGREFFEDNIKPLLEKRDDITDMMATLVEHIAIQIGESVETMCTSSLPMLITGGGAKNKYLVERIQANTKHQVFIPADDIIDYKEALVFAFLGLLRNRNEINVLKSVTGAESDSCSGKIWYPTK
ncbi:MAG: anhydro-N-acetylmuramic acid kinase [Bacteroidales bacterium]|nr:anhydro-N-acetylmuramic acid kinase [Bacteroidales bacterium]